MSEPQSLLQRFFDASLIPADTTDERLAHYQAAAADLAERFGEELNDAVSASRVAIDPSCPATDPWFTIVEEAVKVHWKTFLAKNHDAPRQICRAILLEALSKTAEGDWTATLAIWNACSSLLPHMGSGPEQAVTREFISGIGEECESHSSEQWRIGAPGKITPPAFELKVTAVNLPQVDLAELTNGFSDAAGPHDAQNQSHGNPNPRWPNNNNHWSYEFAPRAAATVAQAVNKAIKATTPAIKGLGDQIAPALKKYSESLAKSLISAAQQNERFTALLWWKQALYSPSLQRSYRGLTATEVIVSLSFDLGSVSGAPVPLSVEYFLRESLLSIFPENPSVTLADLVTDVKEKGIGVPCLPTAPSNSPPHRISLRSFLSLSRESTIDAEAISTFVGIEPTTSLPISEWVVWLLRERQAELLTTENA